MNLTELFLLAVGLATDAFSVAVCQGIRMKKINLTGAFLTALFFGAFQAGMPLIGCFLGNRFADVTTRYEHWIAFILLGIIGGKMIWEAFSSEESSGGEYIFSLKDIFMLSIATSIDAMAVGIVFSARKTNIFLSVSAIGIVTFILALIGVFIGNRFGSKYGKSAEIIGGTVLIFIGLKLFLN